MRAHHTILACAQSAEERTCPACSKGAAMVRVAPGNNVDRRCRYCGHVDQAGWTRRSRSPKNLHATYKYQNHVRPW